MYYDTYVKGFAVAKWTAKRFKEHHCDDGYVWVMITFGQAALIAVGFN